MPSNISHAIIIPIKSISASTHFTKDNLYRKYLPEVTTETLYQLNMDEQLRETCERFYKAEARERGFKNNIARLTKENEELTKTLAEKDAEIARLKVLLESRNISE